MVTISNHVEEEGKVSIEFVPELLHLAWHEGKHLLHDAVNNLLCSHSLVLGCVVSITNLFKQIVHDARQKVLTEGSHLR